MDAGDGALRDAIALIRAGRRAKLALSLGRLHVTQAYPVLGSSILVAMPV